MDELHIQALEVRVLAGIIARLAGRDLERSLAASNLPISALQYGVLRRLSHDDATISELSASMLLSPATLVPAVDALERKGLVRRARDTLDRRRKSLTLTGVGARFLADISASTSDENVARSLACMGGAKSQVLNGLLRELLSEMTQDPGLADRVVNQYVSP
jgi:DNA-binding MarR family transcriptional regulator